MVIAEAPGKDEDIYLKPLVGPTGQLFNEFCQKAGIRRDECYITNVCKYRPPFNDIKKLNLIGIDLNQQITELWENEIRVYKPNVILAMGDIALEAVTGYTGILNRRGSISYAKDGITKVVPTIHPAALFNRTYGSEEDKEQAGGLDYVYHKLIIADFIRAREESESATLSLPQRDLVVAHNSLDVFRFFREYEKCTKAASDIESINCIPVCTSFAFNRNHAISIPLLKNIGSVPLTDMGYNELRECWRIIDEQYRRLQIIGHNFKYDDFKLSRAGFSIPSVHSDTLIKTRVIFPELSDKRLLTVSSLWTREPYYKDEGKEFKLGKSNISQLFLYNAKDSAVEFEVDEAQEEDLIALSERYKIPLVDYYYNYMMRKHKIYLKMENNGFAVDYVKKKHLLDSYTIMEKEVHERITQRVGYEVNVKSTPQKFTLFYKAMGFKERKKNPTSEDTIVALIANHCKGKNGEKNKTILEDILEESRIRDQKSRNINFEPDYDGRCKTSFNISATETCRSSTGVLKKPLRPKKIGLAFHTISKHGRLAKDIRSMFIPDKGKVFIQADSSQAEPRVVAVLCEDWELLKAFDTVDIHRRTAGLIFGYTQTLDLVTPRLKIVDELEKDGPERYTGKTTRNAGNYDVGKRTFMTAYNTNAQKYNIPMTISEWRAGQMLELFHAASPKVRQVFHRDIRCALDNGSMLIDPMGGLRIFNGRRDEDLYKEGYANIPQRTVAHLVQGAMINISDELGDDDQWLFLSENHDAIVMQVPENNWEPYARLMKKHMTKPIDFSIYCTLKRNYVLTIPCDIEFSDTNYANMVKVKV